MLKSLVCSLGYLKHWFWNLKPDTAHLVSVISAWKGRYIYQGIWASQFHQCEAVECHWAWNSSLIHISWTKMWLIRIILLPMEWFAESSFYKNVIVMTSLECKLNCKEASRPSRTFNHLVIFLVICFQRRRETLIKNHAFILLTSIPSVSYGQSLQFQSDNLEFFLHLQHFRIMTLVLLLTCRILHWLCNF